MKTVTALLIWLLTVGTVSQPAAAADTKGRESYRAGVAALRTGATQSAITLLTKAIRQDPRNYRYYNDRGVAHKRAGDLTAALSDYAKALELKPDYENALNNRGVVYLTQGLFDKAIADFSKAVKSETLKIKAYNNLGIAYAGKGDHKEAIKHFNQAISFGSTDHRTHLLLAESLRRVGSPEKALRIYHLALNLSKDPEARRQIESGIASLKQDSGSAQQSTTRSIPDEGKAGETTSFTSVESRAKPNVTTSKARTILRARPLSESASRPEGAEARKEKSDIVSIEDLDNRTRAQAVKKLSPVSAQIYAQGREFVEKSDTAKALVRFEDTRQLERRKRNHYGVAWSDVEIGRAYSTLGEHDKATTYFEESVRLFKKLGVQDESVLAMTELARNVLATRGKNESTAAFNKAMETAVSAGHYTVARAIGDIAAGKTPKVVKQDNKQEDNSARQAVARESASSNDPTGTATAHRDNRNGVTFRWGSFAGKQGVALDSQSAKRDQARKPSELKQEQKQAPVRGESAARQVRQPEKASTTGGENAAQRQEPGKESTEESVQQPPGSGVKTETVQKATSTIKASASQAPRLEKVGTGPNWYVKSGDRIRRTNNALVTRDLVGAAAGKADKSEIEPQPKRVVFWAEGARPAEDRRLSKKRQEPEPIRGKTTLKQDLEDLRQLKAQNNESGMVVVLERLAQRYVKQKELAKALHCLDAAMGFRDDLHFTKGQSEALEQRALVKENLGQSAGGLEDYCRALAFGESRTQSEKDSLRTRANKLASQMGLDSDVTLRTFDALWTARKGHDGIGETRALFELGRIYEKSGRKQEALIYFKRASASMLADSALLHAKMGQNDLAEKLYNEAMDALKEIDYSRFIDLKQRSRIPNTISRQ